MRIGRTLFGEQIAQLPITETLLRTRLLLSDIAGSLESIEAICLQNLEKKAPRSDDVIRSDDGWFL
jgi:hypothetical protein